MDQPFVDYIMTRLKDVDFKGDKEAMIFKITMEIHACHERIERGLRLENEKNGSDLLFNYYKQLASPSVPITKKSDVVFVDVWDVPLVYSIQLDATFPLFQYPYKLFHLNYKNLKNIGEEDNSLCKKVLQYEKPTKTKDFVKIYKTMTLLSDTIKRKLQIDSFFLDES